MKYFTCCPICNGTFKIIFSSKKIKIDQDLENSCLLICNIKDHDFTSWYDSSDKNIKRIFYKSQYTDNCSFSWNLTKKEFKIIFYINNIPFINERPMPYFIPDFLNIELLNNKLKTLLLFL